MKRNKDPIYNDTEYLKDNIKAIYQTLEMLNKDFHDYDWGAADWFKHILVNTGKILINTRWIIALLIILIICVIAS